MHINHNPIDDTGSRSLEADLLASSNGAAALTPATWLPTLPDQGCIHQLIEAQAERSPNAPAVICGSQILTYGELNARANQLARFLVGLGVRREDRVGIALSSSLILPVALMGVLKAGGACLPLDPNYPKHRLELMLEDAQPVVVITQQNLAPVLPAYAAKLVCLDIDDPKIFQGDSDNLNPSVDSDSVAYVIYTSGSTGKPRGVLLLHRGLANHHRAAVQLYDLGASDRILQFSSISFDIAIEEIFPALVCGASVVLKTESFSLQAQEFLPWIRKQQVTVLDLPTAYWHELIHQMEMTPGATLPEKLRLVILGGEKASTKTYRAWQKLAADRVRLINTYGPTEASVIVSAFEPARCPEVSLGDCLPIGRSVSNAELHVLDQDLKPVSIGESGELHIGGTPLARGYLNQASLTAQKFITDPFNANGTARLYKTGDMVRSLADGNLEFLGRIDYQVKIRGFRVEPGEIEALLNQHPGIRESVVVSHENGNGEKNLVAYVIGASDPLAVSSGELRAFLAKQLPEYMVPSIFVMLDRLPLSPNGKVDRRALPKPEGETMQQADFVAPSSDLEARLAAIWESVLGKKPIGIHDDFFEIGGHSLLAARVMHRLGQSLGRTLPLALLFESPTVQKLAAALLEEKWSHYWSSLVPIQPSGAMPPFFCVHGVGGNVLGFQQLGKLMGPSHPFYGLQAQGLDGSRGCIATIEEMATYYIREIRAVQPEGPYCLGGFSFGGLVAYEMAQQLRNGGEWVPLLALFDTYPGNLKPVAESMIKLLRAGSLTEFARAISRSIQRRMNMWFLPRVLKRVFQSNMRAASLYKLQPYSGNVVLFRASENVRGEDDPHAAWQELIPGGLKVEEIPGDHGGILVSPQVKMLADRLQAWVDNSISNHAHLTRSAPVDIEFVSDSQ